MRGILDSNTLFSETTIAVLGGGQLAQMLVEAAILRDVKIVVQTGSLDDPASSKATRIVLANPVNAKATQDLSRDCRGVTFENEWINVPQLRTLEKSGVNFYPSLSAIEPLTDKISQRLLIQKLNIPGPKWILLESISDYPIQLPKGWKFPVIAKASRGGYDGKGTLIIHDSAALERLLRSVNQTQWFLECFIQFEKELAIVASRDHKGTVRTLPLVETHQNNQVCDWVLAPANVQHDVATMAYNIVCSLLTELDYVGVIGIEFFYGKDGLMINEIAPRTHNSGHFSIEACNSSQFDQQLCISAGFVPPDPVLISPGAVMVNLLGLSLETTRPLKQRLLELEALEDGHLHWYGKKEVLGRKLGHVTFLLKSTDPTSRRQEADKAIQRIRNIWPAISMSFS